MLNRRRFTQLSLAALGLGVADCSHISNPSHGSLSRSIDETDLLIWWEQGFLPEENEQLNLLAHKWEQQSGKRVSLKLLSPALIEQQLTKFIQQPNSGQVPDIVYSVGVDTSIAPKLAWQDQLVDLSDLIQPIKPSYAPTALSQVFYRNQQTKQRSYYAVPLWQANDYIHYWKNLLEEIDLTPQDVPNQWDRFWKFWQNAQAKLRAKGYSNLHSIGLCMSSSGFDTYTSLMMFMDAHNVSVIDPSGQFLLAASENRQRFIEALSEFR